MDDMKRAKCNKCESEFDESGVVVDRNGSESCPVCHEQGFLGNVEEEIPETEVPGAEGAR